MSPADDELRTLVHDLRTPLTLVEGFSDLLVRRGDDLPAPERDEYVRRIADAAREMRELLDRVGALGAGGRALGADARRACRPAPPSPSGRRSGSGRAPSWRAAGRCALRVRTRLDSAQRSEPFVGPAHRRRRQVPGVTATLTASVRTSRPAGDRDDARRQRALGMARAVAQQDAELDLGLGRRSTGVIAASRPPSARRPRPPSRPRWSRSRPTRRAAPPSAGGDEVARARPRLGWSPSRCRRSAATG